MKKIACECGGAVQVSDGKDGNITTAAIEALFNSIHHGMGHERCSPAEARKVRDGLRYAKQQAAREKAGRSK